MNIALFASCVFLPIFYNLYGIAGVVFVCVVRAVAKLTEGNRDAAPWGVAVALPVFICLGKYELAAMAAIAAYCSLPDPEPEDDGRRLACSNAA